MESIKPIERTGHLTATVATVTELSPRMRRLTLASPDFAARTWPLGCDIAVVLSADGREVRRRYTVRASDPSTGTITLDAVLHGHGPGSSWAATIAVGDEVSFYGPRGEVPVPEAAWLLALTDEAGLPAVASACEAFQGPSTVFAEVAADSERYPLPASTAVTWLVRGGRDPGQVDLLARCIDELPDRTDWDDGFAYVLGESRAIVTLRDQLSSRGMNRTRIYAKGYWNLNSRRTR